LSEELADLLAAEDVDGFNARRSERSRPDLFAADLAGKRLPMVDLSNANLEKADLTEADLTDANLAKVIASGIDGTGMIMRCAMGLRARFREAWIDNSVIEEADFAQGDFAGAVLDGSQGTGVRFAQARLKNAQCKNVVWPDADLSEAKLYKCDFTGADLRRADFTEASAAEVVLTNAQLDGAVATAAKLMEAELSGASLVAARLNDANLAGAKLVGANLSAADLSRVNLAGADLTGADLSDAVLSEACLDDAILEGANLTGADLSGLDARSLGLDDATIASLSGHGIPYDADAPRNLKGCSVARAGDVVGVVWLNADSEEAKSLRWGVVQGGSWSHGVVSVPADTVLDAQVVSHDGALRLVMLRKRPDGMVLEDMPFSATGPRGSKVVPLGYEPMVRPVFSSTSTGLYLFGLARRGPTVAVHRHDAEEGWVVVNSDRSATAMGFLGGRPVLQGKGNVLTPVGPRGLGDPRRSPDGFPGTTAIAAVDDGDLLCVWGVKGRPPEIPGGLRFARIERRGTPDVEVVSLADHVQYLTSAQCGDGTVMAWLEGLADGIHGTYAWVCRLPDGAPRPVGGDIDDAIRVRVADGVVAVVRADGTAWFGDLDGKPLGVSD
jgi:uncharacterized protein YjbI with pentapeptide repeats